MNKHIILFVFVVNTLFVNAQKLGIDFTDGETFKIFSEKAEATNKLIFVDCYTNWCGPCIKMNKNIFPKQEVGDFYNENFINVKLDMENNPLGKLFFEKYAVQGFPTLIYLDSKGNVVHKIFGSNSVGDFINNGKIALKREKQIRPYLTKLISGDKSFETMTSYLKLVPYATQKEDMINDYFISKKSNEDRFNKDSWFLINNYINDLDNPQLKFLIENKEEFKKRYTANAIEQKLFLSFEKYYWKNYKDSVNVNKRLKEIDSNAFSILQIKLNFIEAGSEFQKSNKDKSKWNNYIIKAQKYYNLELAQPSELNNSSWFVYENYKIFNDVAALKIAQIWSKKSIMLMPESHFMNDTYAHILFDLGEIEEAIKYQKIALKLDPSNKFYIDELARYQKPMD